MEDLALRVQAEFCLEIERLEEGEVFEINTRGATEQGNYGTVCILQNGNRFEKAAVLVSVTTGELTDDMEKQLKREGIDVMRKKNTQASYRTVGLSSAVHPVNPFCPSVHFSYRYFEIEQDGEKSAWFLGGVDLTPAYLDEEDVRHFHGTIKEACDVNSDVNYAELKKRCDEYLYSPARNEYRGVGGFFFENFSTGNIEKDTKFVESCAEFIIPAYIPIVEKNMYEPYTDAQKNWQRFRRGRYVEFNLLYDRGVKFGLASPNAVTDNVFATLPLEASWNRLDLTIEKGSPEDKMMKVLKEPRDWA